jgi:DNA-binding PadR family transcriptional regulator
MLYMSYRSIKPFTVQLLTALAAGEAHGYAIEQQMIEDTFGHIFVDSRNVYRELRKLVEDGLIEEVPGTYPKRYRLTHDGRRTLRSEQGWMLETYKQINSRI